MRKRGARAAFALGGLVAAVLLAGCDGPDRSAEGPSPEEVKAYLAAHPRFLNEHPELIEAAEKIIAFDENLKARTTVAAAIAGHRKILAEEPLIPRHGAARPALTIVEFSDYLCAPCRASHPVLAEAERRNRDIAFVVLPFPVFGNNAEYAARAAHAAQMQGKFHGLHHALMTTPFYVDRRLVLDTAEAQGLDMDKLKRDLEDPSYDAVVGAVRALAAELEIEGPPAFLVGSSLVRGGLDQAVLDEVLAFERCLAKQPDKPDTCVDAALAAGKPKP